MASFAYAAAESDVYAVPEEHRYRVFKNRSDNPVECVIEGIKSLQELWKDLKAKSKQYPNHKLTDEEEEDFQSATQCFLCEKVSDQLVREHCHFTGTYNAPLARSATPPCGCAASPATLTTTRGSTTVRASGLWHRWTPRGSRTSSTGLPSASSAAAGRTCPSAIAFR